MEIIEVPNLGDEARLPRVDAPSLEGLSVHFSPPADFTVEQVRQRFLELARPHATERYRSPVEQADWNDEVLLSLAGYSHGRLVPFSLRHEVWMPLRPEPSLPGLFEQLVGLSPGQATVVDVVLPDDYFVETLRGALVQFRLRLHAAREVVYPDPESPRLLEALGLGVTLEQALRGVLEQMKHACARELVQEARQRVLAEVASRTQVRIPSTLVDQEILMRWSSSEGLALQALEFDEQQQQESLDTWLRDAPTRGEVEQQLRLGLALGAICRRDGLELTPEWVLKLLAQHASELGLTLAQVVESLDGEPRAQARIDQSAWHLMAVEHVMSHVQVHAD